MLKFQISKSILQTFFALGAGGAVLLIMPNQFKP
jgi:hypothetical protein